MAYTLEEWEEKKKKLPQSVIDYISTKSSEISGKVIEQWNKPENTYIAEIDRYYELLVNELMLKYNIKIPIELMDDFVWAMRWDENSAKEVYLTPDYELSKLVYFLRNSLNNESELTISTTINGINNKIDIKHDTNLNHLYFLCDSLLYSRRGNDYQREFEWKEKETYYSKNKNDLLYIMTDKDGTEKYVYDNKINVIAGTVDPYTEDELKHIIKYEREYDKDGIEGYKELRKRKIKDMVSELREKNIFDSTYKTISTTEACFIFDVLVVLETIPHDTTLNNQEKYQYIKRILLS